MLNVIIHSPKGIPNKEKYLSAELNNYRNRKIVKIGKLEKGNIEISFGREITGVKYFAKIYKKNEYANARSFFEAYKAKLQSTNCTRFPELIKELEYGNFSVVFFKTMKRKSKNKRKRHKKMEEVS